MTTPTQPAPRKKRPMIAFLENVVIAVVVALLVLAATS